MPIRWIVLLLITGFPLFGHAEDFSVTSKGSAFSIAGDFQGTITQTRSKITVVVNHGEIFRQPWGAYPKRKIVGLRVLLAVPIPGQTNFDSIARSQLVTINKTLDIGQSLAVGKKRFEIPVRQISAEQLRDGWICFEITDETKEGGQQRGGSCYAHSNRLLSGDERSSDSLKD